MNMKTVRSFARLLMAMGAFLLLTGPGLAHGFYARAASDFCFAFSESTLVLRTGTSHPRSLLQWAESDFQSGLWSAGKAPFSTTYRYTDGRRNPTLSQRKHEGINYKRASLLGTANAGAIFFGLRQAIQSWGKTKGGFHLKDDWRGDNLAQIDELSHLLWGYRMTGFLFSTYRWAGFSGKASHVISISETALILTLVEYPIDAYNPEQGLGVSDLICDYVGIGLAWMKERNGWLEDFDIKVSSRKNILLGNQPLFAQTYEEFDNFVYWLTYRTGLFLPQKIFCFGLGYGVTHPGLKPKREIRGGMGLSLPDLACLLGERVGSRLKFLGIFYPNVSVRF
jgi:hypothetical protein